MSSVSKCNARYPPRRCRAATVEQGETAGGRSWATGAGLAGMRTLVGEDDGLPVILSHCGSQWRIASGKECLLYECIQSERVGAEGATVGSLGWAVR